MSGVSITKTVKFNLSKTDVQTILAKALADRYGVAIQPSDVILKISGGYDGGHGYGYVEASFNGAEVTKTYKE